MLFLLSPLARLFKWLRHAPLWFVAVYFVVGVIPLIPGYILLYTLFLWMRVHSDTVCYSTTGDISFVVEQETLVPDLRRHLELQVKGIRDSLIRAIPYSLQTPLPPFELRMREVVDTRETAFVLHCRLWCDCRDDLPDGSFQLLVYELDPRSPNPRLAIDTVMSWVDYVKPFKLASH